MHYYCGEVEGLANSMMWEWEEDYTGMYMV